MRHCGIIETPAEPGAKGAPTKRVSISTDSTLLRTSESTRSHCYPALCAWPLASAFPQFPNLLSLIRGTSHFQHLSCSLLCIKYNILFSFCQHFFKIFSVVLFAKGHSRHRLAWKKWESNPHWQPCQTENRILTVTRLIKGIEP